MSTALAGVAVAGCSVASLPLDEGEVAAFANRLGTEIRHDVSTIRPLTASDAVSRARSFNYSLRARELEAALADAKVSALSGAMLPKMIFEEDSRWRDRLLATRSSTAGAYTTSSDRSATTQSVTINWSVLDLGLAYLRARQGLDKARQQHEDIRRVRARLAEETRLVFWRSVALDRVERGLERLKPEVANAFMLIERASKDSAIDPMVAINLQREILTLQRDVGQVHTSLASSRGQLANLIGADVPAIDGSLVSDLPRRLTTTADADIDRALRQRPEIRQSMYDLRISADEVEAVILQALPTASFSALRASDTNSFLKFGEWQAASKTISGNLTNLVRLAFDSEAAETQRLVHRQMAVVTAATIAMQVRSARDQLGVNERVFRDAQRIAVNQRRLLAQVSAAARAGKAAPQNVTRERMALLLAEVRLITAFGELDASAAAYASAKGEDRDIDVTEGPR